MTNQTLIETFLPDGRKVVNLYSLVLGGAPLESFVGKTCHIPGFQVGTPPGSVGVAWTVGQIRDLEIKTLGKPFDDKYNPAEADHPHFHSGEIDALEFCEDLRYPRVHGKGFDKAIVFVWVES